MPIHSKLNKNGKSKSRQNKQKGMQRISNQPRLNGNLFNFELYLVYFYLIRVNIQRIFRYQRFPRWGSTAHDINRFHVEWRVLSIIGTLLSSRPSCSTKHIVIQTAVNVISTTIKMTILNGFYWIKQVDSADDLV